MYLGLTPLLNAPPSGWEEKIRGQAADAHRAGGWEKDAQGKGDKRIGYSIISLN